MGLGFTEPGTGTAVVTAAAMDTKTTTDNGLASMAITLTQPAPILVNLCRPQETAP